LFVAKSLFAVKLSPPPTVYRSRRSRGIAVAIENSHLRSVVDHDGAVILDIERGLISTLNPTGAYVWQGLQRGQPVETIIGDLSRETGQDTLTVERDVREFVEDLKQKSLLPQ
jgi:Coenzyme PQQ synthesis protein D (PqqD)